MRVRRLGSTRGAFSPASSWPRSGRGWEGKQGCLVAWATRAFLERRARTEADMPTRMCKPGRNSIESLFLGAERGSFPGKSGGGEPWKAAR